MYNFKRLINLYKSDKLYKVEKEEKLNEFGELVTGEPKRTKIFGAVTPIKPEEIDFSEGGISQHHVKKVYCYEDFKFGDILEFDGLEYTIFNRLDYHENDKGLRIYYMERGDTAENERFN